jgi:hypothetical protein
MTIFRFDRMTRMRGAASHLIAIDAVPDARYI